METSIVKLTPELLSLFADDMGSNALAPFTREVFLLDITVAGTSYCEQIDKVYPYLETGMVLRMQRDPKNKYDENAIGIYFRASADSDDIRIGWVPRTMNTVISRLMDAGKAFFCRINKLGTEDYGKWKQIDCKIYMVE